MIEIQENRLAFKFDKQWQALKYDANGGFFCQHVKRCQNIKAVDIIATNGDLLLLLEIKDFRCHDAQNLPRLSPIDPNNVKECKTQCIGKKDVKIERVKPYLGKEIAEKVKSTLLGLIAVQYYSNYADLQLFFKKLNEDKLPLHIILFLKQNQELEQDNTYPRTLDRLKDDIARPLSFLQPKQVNIVYTQAGLPTGIEWQSISSSPP